MTPRRATYAVSSVMFVLLTTSSAAEEAPAAVDCPCAEIYAAARAEYDKQPGPTFCQSARILPPSHGDDLTLEATKEKLVGAKWRRMTLQLWAFEHCGLSGRCSKCAAYIYAEKKIALVLHKPYRESKNDLSEAELAACKAVIRMLEECGRPYARSQPSG